MICNMIQIIFCLTYVCYFQDQGIAVNMFANSTIEENAVPAQECRPAVVDSSRVEADHPTISPRLEPRSF